MSELNSTHTSNMNNSNSDIDEILNSDKSDNPDQEQSKSVATNIPNTSKPKKSIKFSTASDSASESDADTETETDVEDNSDNDHTADNLNLNADTETMNNQLNNRLRKSQKTDTPAKSVIKVDKRMLKTVIIEWLALDDQIKTYRDTIKEMSEEKKQYEGKILDLMNALKQDTVITDKGNLTLNKKEMKGPITPELIKATLADLLHCGETASVYTEKIISNRPVKENISLKRVNPDKEKKKRAPNSKQKNLFANTNTNTNKRKPRNTKNNQSKNTEANNDEPMDV